MKIINQRVFIDLFAEAYSKCFGTSLTEPLSETESRHFSNTIFDKTGLVIGAKTIKNFSIYILTPGEAKQENPSVATLDTLSRYVLNAPYISEVERKEKEGHYSYWYQFKGSKTKLRNIKSKPVTKKVVSMIGGLIVLVFFLLYWFARTGNSPVADNFLFLQEDSLHKRGWILQSKDERWWGKRDEQPAHLTLYTLKGDNWPDSANAPIIKNLLLRKLPTDCFITEIRLDDFLPKQNWQQAGILLLEDTIPGSKCIRLSIGYNDFFGGFAKPGEIIVQGIITGDHNGSKPEEIIHLPLFALKPGQESLVHNNLRKSGLQIEKNGKHFRFLYSTSPLENFAFKEVLRTDLSIHPNYIGIFALQGFTRDTVYIPARFSYFSLLSTKCRD